MFHPWPCAAAVATSQQRLAVEDTIACTVTCMQSGGMVQACNALRTARDDLGDHDATVCVASPSVLYIIGGYVCSLGCSFCISSSRWRLCAQLFGSHWLFRGDSLRHCSSRFCFCLQLSPCQPPPPPPSRANSVLFFAVCTCVAKGECAFS